MAAGPHSWRQGLAARTQPMSTSVLKIIPTDQDYVPSAEQQANAVDVFREMAPYGEIETRVYEDLEFIDAGEYCGYVLCPSCGNRIAINPFEGTDLAQDWYSDLDQAITARTVPIRHFQTTMPCCGASVALPRCNSICRPALLALRSVP